jgi:hypothetical protein
MKLFTSHFIETRIKSGKKNFAPHFFEPSSLLTSPTIVIWMVPYPFDCFKELNIEWISRQLALEVDERMTGGHRLDQDRVLCVEIQTNKDRLKMTSRF